MASGDYVLPLLAVILRSTLLFSVALRNVCPPISFRSPIVSSGYFLFLPAISLLLIFLEPSRRSDVFHPGTKPSVVPGDYFLSLLATT